MRGLGKNVDPGWRSGRKLVSVILLGWAAGCHARSLDLCPGYLPSGDAGPITQAPDSSPQDCLSTCLATESCLAFAVVLSEYPSIGVCLLVGATVSALQISGPSDIPYSQNSGSTYVAFANLRSLPTLPSTPDLPDTCVVVDQTSCFAPCTSGFAGSADGLCSACAPGSFSPSNNTLAACNSCDDSFYTCNPLNGSATSCPAGTAGSPFGYCHACILDTTYAPNDNTLSTCTNCSISTSVCETFSGIPLTCASGFAGVNPESPLECLSCPPLSFAPAFNNLQECTLCDSNNYACSQKTGQALACAGGNFLVNGTCSICPALTWAPVNNELKLCNSCAIGTSACNNTTGNALSCTAGYASNDLNCAPCTEGTFSVAGNTCTSCSPNDSTCSPTTGAALTCNAGKFLSGNTCIECQDSWTSANNTATTCKSCSDNTATCDTTNGKAKSCNAGYYGADSGSCQPCPLLTWAVQNNTLPQCSPCDSSAVSCDPTNGSFILATTSSSTSNTISAIVLGNTISASPSTNSASPSASRLPVLGSTLSTSRSSVISSPLSTTKELSSASSSRSPSTISTGISILSTTSSSIISSTSSTPKRSSSSTSFRLKTTSSIESRLASTTSSVSVFSSISTAVGSSISVVKSSPSTTSPTTVSTSTNPLSITSASTLVSSSRSLSSQASTASSSIPSTSISQSESLSPSPTLLSAPKATAPCGPAPRFQLGPSSIVCIDTYTDTSNCGGISHVCDGTCGGGSEANSTCEVGICQLACGVDASASRSLLETIANKLPPADIGGGLIGTLVGLAVAQVVAAVAPQAMEQSEKGFKHLRSWLKALWDKYFDKFKEKIGDKAAKKLAKYKFRIPRWLRGRSMGGVWNLKPGGGGLSGWG